MFQRILVPLDGSARAQSAIPVAARLARAAGGRVVLIEVANVHLEYGPYRDPDTASLIAVDRDFDAATTHLSSLTKSPDLAGIPTETRVPTGPVAETIVAEARAERADIIVMSSRGRTGLARWVLGSVARQVVRQASVPVLLLREAGSTAAPSRFEGIGRIRILVPLDGSSLAETALGPAAELARALAGSEGAALHLLRVPETPARLVRAGLAPAEALKAPALEAIRANSLASLEYVAQRLQAGPPAGAELSVTWSVTLGEDPAQVIVEMAEDHAGMRVGTPEGAHPYDVIAMATHGRGGLERLTLGSVTERVVNATRLPMLITRPPREGEK